MPFDITAFADSVDDEFTSKNSEPHTLAICLTLRQTSAVSFHDPQEAPP
ncbi:MAG: hypothetical protein ACKOEO_16595 [Planctomycetaceae bacterium]